MDSVYRGWGAEGWFFHTFELELKQISEISGYPFQIHYPDKGFELFRIVANYFKQLLNIYS